MIGSKFTRPILGAALVASCVSAQCLFEYIAGSDETCAEIAVVREYSSLEHTKSLTCPLGLRHPTC